VKGAKTQLTSSNSDKTPNQTNRHQDRKKQKAAEQKRLRDLDKLTTKIEKAEQELAKANHQIAEAGFFKQSAEQQTAVYDKVTELEKNIMNLMEMWEGLETD
jgi:hypothetical protein